MKYKILYGTPLEVEKEINEYNESYYITVVGYAAITENKVTAVIHICKNKQSNK